MVLTQADVAGLTAWNEARNINMMTRWQQRGEFYNTAKDLNHSHKDLTKWTDDVFKAHNLKHAEVDEKKFIEHMKICIQQYEEHMHFMFQVGHALGATLQHDEAMLTRAQKGNLLPPSTVTSELRTEQELAHAHIQNNSVFSNMASVVARTTKG